MTIAIARGDVACPARASREWLDAAGIETGPIFRPIDKAGKRGFKVTLPLSGDRFAVPVNVHVLGNTADRSIALLDIALRRRFGFVELMPDIEVLGAASAGGSVPLGLWLSALNERLRVHLGRDARNLQIGHAYLLEGGHPVTDFSRFVQILAEDIVPLLEEYCYEDYGALAQILGSELVDEVGQRIRQELFSSGKRAELVQALLEPAKGPEIVLPSYRLINSVVFRLGNNL